MQQVIKIRAWLPKTKKMVHFDSPHINYEYGLFALECSTEEYQGICEMPQDYEDALFMIFTGLKDKTGVDIFEGDIVTTDYPAVKNMCDYWVVELGHTGMFQLYSADMPSFKESIHDLVYNKWKLEVLGSIYENPELLV